MGLDDGRSPRIEDEAIKMKLTKSQLKKIIKEEIEEVDSAMPYTGPDSIKEEIATLDRVYDQIRTATQAVPEDESAMKGLWHLEQAIDLLSRWG